MAHSHLSGMVQKVLNERGGHSSKLGATRVCEPNAYCIIATNLDRREIHISGMDELNYSDRMQLPVLEGLAAPLEAKDHSGAAISINQVVYHTKRQHGVYYTPSQVAELLVNWAIRTKHDLILEPSFGGCAFLEASVNQLRKLGCNTPERQLSGFDIDPQAFVHLAKFDSCLCELGNRFIHGDFLSSSISDLSGQKADVIVGNPPFVPYRRMNVTQRKVIEDWAKNNTSVVEKDSSLWAYFLQHALQFLKPGARMAWILPSSLLFVEYGHSLRALIQRHFETSIFVDLQEQLFIDSGTRERTVLLFSEGFSNLPLQNSTAATLTFSRFSEVESHFAQTKTLTSTRQRSRQQDEPLERSAELIAEALVKTPYLTLGEISNVLIGDVVGDTSYFVNSQTGWSLLGINDDELRPLLTKSSQVSGIRITRSNVRKMIEKGRKCLLLHPNTSKPSKAAEEYLAAYPMAKRESNATFSRRPDWFLSSYDDTADLFFPSLSTIGPRIIVNSCKLACANSLYRIHLYGEWRVAKFAIALYGASSFAQLSAELIGGGMGEGALKLNPSHLKQLPIFSHLYDNDSDTYDIFIKVHRLIARGSLTQARKMADEWLAPVLNGNVLAQMSDMLDVVRMRRRDYRCEF